MWNSTSPPAAAPGIRRMDGRTDRDAEWCDKAGDEDSASQLPSRARESGPKRAMEGGREGGREGGKEMRRTQEGKEEMEMEEEEDGRLRTDADDGLGLGGNPTVGCDAGWVRL